jgi:hypothetical protein
MRGYGDRRLYKSGFIDRVKSLFIAQRLGLYTKDEGDMINKEIVDKD